MDRQIIFATVKENIQAIVEKAAEHDIKESDSMLDYGADSLEIVEVVSRSMKQLKIRIPRTELAQAKNISELVDIFEKHASSAEVV
jgi:polyketide biosynthesis acyl carrier protein